MSIITPQQPIYHQKHLPAKSLGNKQSHITPKHYVFLKNKDYLTTQTTNILKQKAVDTILKEKSPERQRMYALLDNKKLCKTLLSPSKPNEDAETQALRKYFTKHPLNLVGLSHNRKAFFNVMDSIDESFTRQINALVRQPRNDKEFTHALFTLMLMHKGFKDFKKHLKKHPEPFFQGMKTSEKMLFSPLAQGKSQNKDVKFSGEREDINKYSKNTGKAHGGVTAGSCALFNAALSTGLTASAGPTLGILPAIVAYAKFAKSVNGDHSEVKYFGRSLTDDLTTEIFERENPNDTDWDNTKNFIYENIKKFQLPWKVLKPIESVYSKLNTTDKLADTIREGSSSGSTLIEKSFKQIAKSRGYYPPDYSEITKDYDIPEQFFQIHNLNKEWAQHYAEIQAEHINWDTLETVFSNMSDAIEAVDDSVPVVGILLSMWKAAAIYNNGSQVSTLSHNDRSSSLAYLNEHSSEARSDFVYNPLSVMPRQIEKMSGFVSEYFNNPEDYDPIATITNTIDKLFGSLFRDN